MPRFKASERSQTVVAAAQASAPPAEAVEGAVVYAQVIPGDEPQRTPEQPFDGTGMAPRGDWTHSESSSDDDSERLFELSEQEQEQVSDAHQRHDRRHPRQQRRRARKKTKSLRHASYALWRGGYHDSLDDTSPLDRPWREWVLCFRKLGPMRTAIYLCLVLGTVCGVVGLIYASMQPVILTPCGNCNPTGTVDGSIHCASNSTRCACLQGWAGAICERCNAQGYSGSPWVWGGCQPIPGYVPPPPASPVTEQRYGDDLGLWHDISEEQAEWDTAWYTNLEIGFAVLISLTIFALLVLCFCC